MNCFLFDSSQLRRSWPATMGVGVGDDAAAGADPTSVPASYEARLPEGWTVARTKQAILAQHPALKAVWGRRLGYHLMFVESEVLIAVLKELLSKSIPALGLHDG